MAKGDLTADRARALFRYDQDTGNLYRQHASGERLGKAKSNGYLVVGIDGYSYQVHRVIWLIVYGRWPDYVIDHINRDRLDNRIGNLRDVPLSVNSRNSARCDVGRAKTAAKMAARLARKRDLPTRVYLKHGAYYYVSPGGNKWHRLSAAKDGFDAAMRELEKRQSAGLLDNWPAAHLENPERTTT